MHVLMLSWEYPPHVVGGLGKHVIDLLPALANEDIQVTLVTPMLQGGAASETIDSHITIVRVLPNDPPCHNFTAFVAQVNRHLEHAAYHLYKQTGGFDLIHNHDWMTAEVSDRLSQQWMIPMITTIHATERGRWQGGLYNEMSKQIDAIERRLCHEAQRVIVCSNYMANQVVNDFDIIRDKTEIVPNAVYLNPDPFTNPEERRTFRRRFAGDHQYIAFFIGRMVHEKGLHVLLDAWARVLHHVPGRLIVAGSGPHLEACKNQTRNLGLNEAVAFLGQISNEDRDRLYHSADVAVFPSIYEPFGIVALEAMAAECPVVVTQTGGLQEIVCPHETGITVVPDNVDSLVWGILHTLQNPTWARARAANALRDLSQVYSWQHVAQEHLTIYQRVCAEWQECCLEKKILQPSEPVLSSVEPTVA